ncbi:MAG TPA: hypothetical protein VFL34_18085 [Candidatus Sulfotelmatobacter sp.]|nr:hypothetical protein [Candidatus Sulfotelmatobacter sp.]
MTGFNEHFAAIAILSVRVEKAQLDKGTGYTLDQEQAWSTGKTACDLIVSINVQGGWRRLNT